MLQALIDICLKVSKAVRTGQMSAAKAGPAGSLALKEKPFDAMNTIVANLLLSLTG